MPSHRKQKKHSPRESHNRRKRAKRSSSRSRSRSRNGRHRRMRNSSVSDESHQGDEQFYRQLEEKRAEAREQKRRAKELLKATETPEEKRARRIAKKKEKQLKRSMELGWPGDYIGYDNADNPYGDPNLTRPFIWKRKLEKEGRTDIAEEELIQTSRNVLEQNRAQLEQIKKDRLMREMLKEDIEVMRRERELQQFTNWKDQEEQFHLQQARERSKIRIQDGRAQPIDYLAAYIYCLIEDEKWLPEHYRFSAPQDYCKGLSRRQCEDLLADIRVYQRLQEGEYDSFWCDVATIAEERRRSIAAAEGSAVDRRQAVSSAVISDIEKIFSGKSVAQLVELVEHVKQKISSVEDGLDISYWEAMLDLLLVHIANVRLYEIHEKAIKKKQDALLSTKRETRVKEETLEEPGPSSAFVYEAQDERASDSEKDAEEEMMQAYRTAGYSPVYIGENEIPAYAVVVTSDESTQPVLNVEPVTPSEMASIQNFEGVARMGMGRDEATFAVEQEILQDTSLWSDRFKPRKPRYFNRVHTGFEWNKYNQTHYDLDNPPPKIVQGYKFNIFYPDLLEPKPPTFTVLPCEKDTDFCIIRFHAGPPYEDVAFKIVQREWEVSQKKGYRCVFQNGIFQLWFQFKKYRYRR